jgi:hypothetical protein
VNEANIYQHLSEPFPQEMERVLNKAGVNLTYIPVSEVINRLNKVLGVDKWSFQVLRVDRDATDPDFITAHVRLHWYLSEFNTVDRDGIGGQRIKRNKQGQIVDLGDDYKGAVSDALKKAAQTLGVGLYLARSEDAIEIEQVIENTAQAAPAALTENQTKVKEMIDGLSVEQKAVVKQFWSEQTGGAPKPISKWTDEEVELVVSEIVRIKFSA